MLQYIRVKEHYYVIYYVEWHGRTGDIESAIKYALEAITIGHSLGDKYIECINIINLGNAYRQAKEYDNALDCYEKADKIARESKYLADEAKAQELIASIYNYKNDGNRAIQHALYSIGLSRDGSSSITEKDAYEELARGYELIHDINNATSTWVKIASLEYLSDNVKDSVPAFLKAIRHLCDTGDLRAYIDIYNELYLKKASDVFKELYNHEILINDYKLLIEYIPVDYIFEFTVYHLKLLFFKMPDRVIRQSYIHIFTNILGSINPSITNKSKALALLALSMSVSDSTLKLHNIAYVSSLLSNKIHPISFRAQNDGAVTYTVNVSINRPIIISITQIDDNISVALVALCLALVLVAFSEEISEDVLSGLTPYQSEVNIQLINYEEALQLGLPLDKIGLESMTETCAVTRAVDPKHDIGVPIAIILRNDIIKDWLVGTGVGNSEIGRASCRERV